MSNIISLLSKLFNIFLENKEMWMLVAVLVIVCVVASFLQELIEDLFL